MKVEINENGETIINDIKIKDEIFNEEMVEYRLREREQMIDSLIDWISECENNDKEIMKTDLKEIIGMNDEYLFSSISTNEYIFESINPKIFNEICKEILELNKEVKNE